MMVARAGMSRHVMIRGSFPMNRKLTMIYWKSDRFWLGKLLEHPEIMTQGETLEELEENLKDAYLLMAMDDVPESYDIKEITLWRGAN
jgi:predicted RNase H-like HicB family nuclease